MDNEAFRSLVNKQVKSTKEIAREAVETEFREKAQKRGGGGGGRRGRRSEYDSDSASDDDNDHLTKRRRDDEGNNSNEPEWKRRRKEKAAAATATTVYRDRAKERREGKNLDYNDTSTVTANIYNNGDEYSDKKRQAELSKFLGGDEQHTHLVKGLDVALASKIRREEMGNKKQTGAEREEEEDLDQLLEDAYNTQKNETTTSSVSTNSKKSSSIAMIQPKSDLGKSVQKYLLKHYQQQPSVAAATQQQSIQINPTKQNSIQRSHYTFSLDSTIQNRSKAWDVPQLKMIGGGQQQQRQQQVTMTPLDCHLIATIRNKLDGTLKSKKANDDGGREGIDQNDNGVKQHQLQQLLDNEGDNTKEPSSGDNTIDHKTTRGSPPANNKKDDDSNEDDSDDDIFADVGAYIPPTAVATTTTTTTTTTTAEDSATAQTKNHDVASTSCTTTTKKNSSSIFDNLITDESKNDGNKLHKRQPMQLPHTQEQQNTQHVIDRDVFGGNRKKQQEQQQTQSMKRRGPHTAAMEGVSMANYQGGYGEEMDTDFLNEDEDVDRKMKRRDVDHGDDDEGSKGENVDADEED
jgi:hypothetical protein